jgi:hypothetical protein
MLNQVFNQSRSYTKFFDITQAGAVGIYANPGPWQHLIEHEQNGLLCAMAPQAWIEAILGLAADALQREVMHSHARARINGMSG